MKQSEKRTRPNLFLDSETESRLNVNRLHNICENVVQATRHGSRVLPPQICLNVLGLIKAIGPMGHWYLQMDKVKRKSEIKTRLTVNRKQIWHWNIGQKWLHQNTFYITHTETMNFHTTFYILNYWIKTTTVLRCFLRMLQSYKSIYKAFHN